LITLLKTFNKLFLLLTFKEKTMRSEMLYSILSELNGSSPDIEASAILSSDGLVMAAILPQSIEE